MTKAMTQPVPSLRERKKHKTRRELAKTALELFADKGFASVTLDELVDAVEVSKRTFFRNFASKEEVAIASEVELWEAYADRVAELELSGTVLDALRDSMLDTLRDMPEGWTERFFTTRGLISHSDALRSASLKRADQVQTELVQVLAPKLGVNTNHPPLRLAIEIAIGAYRCGARLWISDQKRHGTGQLIDKVRLAFDGLNDSLTLTASR